MILEPLFGQARRNRRKTEHQHPHQYETPFHNHNFSFRSIWVYDRNQIYCDPMGGDFTPAEESPTDISISRQNAVPPGMGLVSPSSEA